jgi:hypothetical protein
MMKRKLTVADLLGLGSLDPKRANFVIELSKDWDARRAAVASGYAADYGYKLRDEPDIQAAIDTIIAHRLEASHISAEWVLMEAVDNHLLARQLGNITASNTALNLIAKHAAVDAFAAERVQVVGDEAVKERLLRARIRRKPSEDPTTPSFM